MKPQLLWILMGALYYGCETPASSFDFTLTGATGRVQDSAATGEVDNAGHLTLDDEAWHFSMSLGGLTVGNHDAAQVSILDKSTNALLSTAVSGSCTVTLDPHEPTNGSKVSGVLTCTALRSSPDANKVDVTGQFLTYINDAGNNPNPPGP